MTNLWKHQAQETEGDYFFDGQMYVTTNLSEHVPQEEIAEITIQLQKMVVDNEGLDYLQVFNHSDGRKIYCIDSLSREMENGGFGQLFHHDTGAYCLDILEALAQIRAKKSLAIFQQVVDLFPNGHVPTDEDERIEIFDQLSSELVDEIAQCDDRFYDAGENLVELTLKFVTKNVAQFR